MTTLKNRVMLRVYALFAMRLALSPLGLRTLGLFSALLIISLSVSLRHVFLNMPALYDIPALITFHTEAFRHTTLIVQMATLGGLALMFFIARDALKLSSGKLSF